MPQVTDYKGIWVEVYIKHDSRLLAYGITLDSWHKTWAKRLQKFPVEQDPKALAMTVKWGRM